MSTNSPTGQSTARALCRSSIVVALLVSALFAATAWTAERDVARRHQAGDLYEHGIVLRVPYGNGASEVGLLPDGNDEHSRGPASFAINGDSILVLDSEHGRVIDFDRNGTVRQTMNDVRGVDLATNGSSTFVLDAATESVVRISSDGSRSTVQGLPSDVLRLEKRDTVGYEVGGQFVSLEGTSRVSSQSLASSPGDTAGEFDYADIDRHTGTVRDRWTGVTLTVRTTQNLGSMNVIGVDDAHDIFVAVEQLLDGGRVLRVAKEVRKFAPDGSLRSVIPINIDYAAHPVREFVVTPDGTLYHLLPLKNVLLVEEWRER
jgi:hypothetical protein